MFLLTVNCPSQETEVTLTSTRPVLITTKGLQDRNIHILDSTTVENKGKFILYECLLRTYLSVNQSYQILHLNGFSPVSVYEWLLSKD
jgi:hypothetical protein